MIELEALDLRRDLLQVRAELARRLDEGAPASDLLDKLAELDPVALGELLLGPHALKRADAVRAALGVIGALEARVATTGLYRRLVDLSPEAGPAVLATAAARHPAARWLVPLSKRVEGALAGQTHLEQLADAPAFAAACQMHAEAGHRAGLIAAAAHTRRPEPATALLAAGAEDAAAEAAIRLLEVAPDSAVIAWLAAVWGPDLDPLCCRMLPYLRSAVVADRLAPWLAPYPEASARLSAIRRALPRAQGQP